MLQFCSVSNSPLTDNTFRNPFEPFRIKWEEYFSKELCLFVLIVLNMFMHASAYEYGTLAQSAGAVEYTDGISAEEKEESPNEYPDFYTRKILLWDSSNVGTL